MNSWTIALSAYGIDLVLRMILRLDPWTPDIMMLAVVYLSLTTTAMGEAYLIAFVFGYLWDGVFLDFVGMHSFLFVVIAMMTEKFRSLVWAQYAASRLLMGFVFSAVMRFGETIFWLSNMDHEIPAAWPQQYILSGAIVSGICFMLFPWRSRPIKLADRSPHTIYSERRV